MNEAAIFTAQKIFQQDAEGKRQFRERVDAVFFQLFEAMNLKGLRADVELVASAERIPCGDGHSLSFRVSAQLYIITENEKRRRHGTISAKRAANAGNAGGPIEEKRFSADHVGCRRTELGNAAVEAIAEIVSDNEERPCRNDYRMKYRIIG